MEHRGRYIPRALGVIGAAAAASLVIVYIVVAIRQRSNPPSCVGIGFGCEPDAGGSVFLWGVFAVMPATVVAVALLLLSMLAPAASLRRTGPYGIAAVYGLLAVAGPFFFGG